MLVAFWGPTAGQTCTTSSMLAVSAMLVLDYSLKIAVTSISPGDMLLNRALSQLILRPGRRTKNDSGGMDGILRLAECELLTPSSLRDYTESVLKDRLDLLSVPSTGTEERLHHALPLIVHTASRYYDLFFVNATAGVSDPATALLLEKADLIVVTLNQNAALLDSYFASVENRFFSKDKKHIYCIGSYDGTSKYSLERLKRTYKLPASKTGAVPRNTRFMDAVCDGNLLDYLLRSMAVKKQAFVYDENVAFISSIRDAGKHVLRQLDLAPLQEVLMD